MDEFLGTVKAFAFSYAPPGWLLCNGQQLSISQNSALFAIIGTTYGGNGQTTFAVPDLRGRSIVHPGQGPGLTNVNWGEIGGTESTTLLLSNVPAHVHNLVPGTGAGQINLATVANAISGTTISNDTDGGNNSLAAGGNAPNLYSEPGGTTSVIAGITSTVSGTTAIAGNGQAFNIRNPYLGIYMSISTTGIFPTRN